MAGVLCQERAWGALACRACRAWRAWRAWHAWRQERVWECDVARECGVSVTCFIQQRLCGQQLL
eukprot:365598-Chlamydomonas_euryale.AAC.5